VDWQLINFFCASLRPELTEMSQKANARGIEFQSLKPKIEGLKSASFNPVGNGQDYRHLVAGAVILGTACEQFRPLQ